MPSKIRRLDPVLRLNERVLGPVRHLARMAGVSPAEIIEFMLEEVFEGAGALPAPARPSRARGPAAVIPIARARNRALRALHLPALRRGAERVRDRAREARRHAAAACAAASAARTRAVRALDREVPR
jgi:hypothetical protein